MKKTAQEVEDHYRKLIDGLQQDVLKGRHPDVLIGAEYERVGRRLLDRIAEILASPRIAE